ncbi:MAG: DUF1622 domain-containing protein [Bacilli bacterium]|nr:DUF1622 domain-containing protein [Bacilli bacterium]
MQETFELGINNVFYWIIWFFELLGALVMVAGAIYSCVKYVICQIKHKPYSIKVMIGNYMSIGLELMLVAEVLKTVITNNRTMEEFIILASIILLRATLSLLIHWELKTEEKKMDVADKKTKRLKQVD